MDAKPRPDVEGCIVFLKAFFGEDQWPLTAAIPRADGGGLRTAATFGLATERECRKSIAKHNKDCEIYFQPNPLKVPLTDKHRKASKDEVQLARSVGGHGPTKGRVGNTRGTGHVASGNGRDNCVL